MKKKILLVSVILILLTVLTSCDLTPMEEGRSVNEYIFPYVKFELTEDEDGNECYSATVVSGAAVGDIYIPATVEDNENPKLPVKYFKGFENDEDVVNLKSTVFESSETEIKLDSLDQATILSTISFNKVEEGYKVWKNLPVFEHTEESEFQGWYLVRNGARIYNGDIMIPGYTAVEAKWGTHVFSQTYEGKDPTCTEAGWTSYHYCTNPNCGYTTKEEIPALGHNLEKREKSNPTCITVGYEYDVWQCTRCGRYFSDSEGKTEIENTSSLVIPFSGHTSDGERYNDETYHWLKCSVCHENYDINKHTYGNWYVDEEKGTQKRECSYCGYVEESSEGHEWVYVEEEDSTCTKQGHDAYYKCKNHEDEYTLSNDPVEIINEKTLHEKTDRKLKEHELSGWKDNGEEHYKECLVCGKIFDKGKHEYEYTFVPSGERKFDVTIECSICGATEPHSKTTSAFDVSASFGKIRITGNSSDGWKLSYYGSAESCYWTDESGNKIAEGKDGITVNAKGIGNSQLKVFCYAITSSGQLDISLALLSGN